MKPFPFLVAGRKSAGRMSAGSLRVFFLSVFLLVSLPAFLAAQISGGDTGALNAAEEFRTGVQAYNRYAFGEAILSFERALSFKPGEGLILDWLGRAYYRSGFEEAALSQWQAALSVYGVNTGPGILMASRIETVANRRFLLPVADDEVRYVEAGRYPGINGENVLYRQPTAVLPEADGSAWIVAYGSNELVRIDVNGVIKDRKRGPLNGFDRPYDLARGADGRLYLSEYRGGRVSILDSGGNWLAYIGSKGLKPGQFIGPQNLAVDGDGYLYVVDYGNRRISKFDPDGAFILSFGLKTPLFPGFLSPTGIAAGNGRIYIADAVSKQISMFDPNGNYLGVLTGGLSGPESLRFLSGGKLLAADTNRLLLIDTDSALVRELGLAGNRNIRITGADMDRNGSILAANFAAGEVSVLTRFDDLASGLFVQIERVYAQRFPEVTVELRVEDRLRRPITGLEGLNFLVSEGGQVAEAQRFLSPAYRSGQADISLLIERSPQAAALRDDLAAAARDISRALGEGSIISVISAGAQPERARFNAESAASLENAARGTAAVYSPRWRFDLGLRLAAADLLPAGKKRAVVYIGTGGAGELAFEQYSLSEMASYLANNGIAFYAVITGGSPPKDEIQYLCRETGGQAQMLYRPEGIGEMIKSIAAAPSGSYSMSYTSRLQTNFGRAYLPVEVEVYLMERSGRDSTGYFPPLE